jgi:hypothetical protein
MASAALKPVPSAAQIDLKAIEYRRLEEMFLEAKADLATASEPLSKLKADLIELVRQCGGMHAEKSKILHGILWEIMATFGQSTSLDAAAVERLRLGLVKAKQARLLKKLFQKDTRWTFQPGAAIVIKGEKISARVKSLLLDCFVTSYRTPTLDVREKKIAG